MRYISGFIFLLFLFACQHNAQEDQRVVEEITDPALVFNSDIIRNPVSAKSKYIDTINIAKFEFKEPFFDFGAVAEGELINHDYEFTNVGRVPLVITHASSTCGCTVPNWSKEAIAPGKKGKISVKFDSNGKSGPQAKVITIVANTYPSNTTIELAGVVNGKKQ